MRELIMRDNYEKFLQRMNQYRVKVNMTQEDTSSALGITQSQFSKMELGRVIVSYKALEILLRRGWDIDFLFTGRESSEDPSELSILLLREKESRRELLGALAWILEHGVKKNVASINAETRCEIELLKRRVVKEKPETVLHDVRILSGISQIPMSEKLGVNIRKYRMLEKEESNPDAELLLRIYEETGCKPSLLFRDTDVESRIVDDLWNKIDPLTGQRILSLAKQVLWFLRM